MGINVEPEGLNLAVGNLGGAADAVEGEIAANLGRAATLSVGDLGNTPGSESAHAELLSAAWAMPALANSLRSMAGAVAASANGYIRTDQATAGTLQLAVDSPIGWYSSYLSVNPDTVVNVYTVSPVPQR